MNMSMNQNEIHFKALVLAFIQSVAVDVVVVIVFASVDTVTQMNDDKSYLPLDLDGVPYLN